MTVDDMMFLLEQVARNIGFIHAGWRTFAIWGVSRPCRQAYV